MGGEIGVNSSLGEGLEFFAEITFAASDKAAEIEPNDGLEGLRILVVNPIDSERSTWQRYLDHWGAEVTGVAALDDVVAPLAEAAGAGQPFAIVVFEGDHDIDGVQSLRSSLVDGGGADALRFVISQDPRRPKDALKGLADVTLVDSNPVRRVGLLNAVAIAAGRASPEVDYEEEAEDLRVGRAPTIEEAREQGKLILLAEDNLTNQEVIRRQLTVLGYAREIASDGQEGLDMWQAGDYVVLLTDCHMPEMDGFELTAAIRQAALKAVFGDDQETFKEILESFVEPTEATIGELKSAWDERNAPDIKGAAHKLKSSSRSVGANELADTCQAADWGTIDELAPRLDPLYAAVKAYIDML